MSNPICDSIVDAQAFAELEGDTISSVRMSRRTFDELIVEVGRDPYKHPTEFNTIFGIQIEIIEESDSD